MAKIGDEKPQTLIAISDKTLKATCLGFHVLLLLYIFNFSKRTAQFQQQTRLYAPSAVTAQESCTRAFRCDWWSMDWARRSRHQSCPARKCCTHEKDWKSLMLHSNYYQIICSLFIPIHIHCSISLLKVYAASSTGRLEMSCKMLYFSNSLWFNVNYPKSDFD